MLIVLTSERGISLQNVAKDIVSVAKRLNVGAELHLGLTSLYELKRLAMPALIVMAVDPIAAMPWLLLNYECNTKSFVCLQYATIEGRPLDSEVKEWMTKGRYVAVSNYVKQKLREAGFPVEGVVHHGIDMELVKEVEKNKHLGKKYISHSGINTEKYIVATTFASTHPRKGLPWLAKAAEIVAKKDPNIIFFVVSSAKAYKIFAKHNNVVVAPYFGDLDRLLNLAIIAASDMYVMPSLAEGFGLPALEAMAFGVPLIHADLPPLREFSLGWSIPVKDVVDYVHTSYPASGIVFEHHLYDPVELAETIIQVADMIRRKDSAIDDYRAKAKERAMEMDIMKLYPNLIFKLVPSGQ